MFEELIVRMNLLKSIKKRGLLIVFFVVAFYGVIVLYSDYSKITHSFHSIQLIYFPFILFSVILGIFLKSERQRFLLKAVSINISIKDSFIIFNAGQTLLITPGGVGSVIKSVIFKQKFGHSFSKTIPMILVERYFDMAGIISLISIFLVFRFSIEFIIPTIIVAIIMLIVIFTIRNKKLFLNMTKLFKKIKIINKYIDSAIESRNNLLVLTSKKNIAYALPFSILCWFVDAVAVYLCFLSFNLNFDIFSTSLISLTSLVLGTVSFLPGGLGITEISMMGFLVNHGTNISLATALVIYTRIMTIWFSTILGFLSAKFALKKIE